MLNDFGYHLNWKRSGAGLQGSEALSLQGTALQRMCALQSRAAFLFLNVTARKDEIVFLIIL